MSSPTDQQALNGGDAAIPACPNCGDPRPGPYCAWCGQNERDYRRSSWSLVGDLLRETFEVDSKVFRTLKLLLLKPGQLSAEFSRNRRASYMSPVRLYLFASVIYLLAVNYGQSIGGPPGTVETAQPSSTSGEIDAAEGASSSLLPSEAQIAYLRAVLPPRSLRKLDELLNRRDGPETIGAYLYLAGDLSARDPDAASLTERVAWTGFVDFLHDPGFFQDQVFGGISVGVVFFVPVSALLLALVYYRKKRYFAEHLVLQLHVQTFTFLVTSVVVLLPAGLFGSLGRTILSLWALYYALAAMRRFYKDSWMRTLFKTSILVVLYMLLITPVFFAMVALSL